MVKRTFPPISLSTMYKTIERFIEVGLIESIAVMANGARYHVKSESHHQMVCVKCQAVQDIADPIKGAELSLPQKHGFDVLGHVIIVRGYCPKCLEK